MTDDIRTSDRHLPLLKVTGSFYICEPCLDGKGGECHTPGCVLWLNRAPDLQLRSNLEDHGCVISHAEAPTTTVSKEAKGLFAVRSQWCSRWCPTCEEMLGRPHREGCNWDPIAGPPSLDSDPKEPKGGEE